MTTEGAGTTVGPVEQEPDGRHRPGTAGYRRLNQAMFVAGLAGFGLLYGTQPVLPLLASEFDVAPGAAALTVSVTTGALAVCALPMTAVARRRGRVATMRIGLLVAALGSVAGALAPDLATLVAARLLVGVALAAVVAVAMGHVGAEVHPVGLGATMGLYVAGNSVGGVTGRVVGAAAADVGGWRAALVVLGVLAAVALLVFVRLLPEPVGRPPAAPGPTTPVRAVPGRLLALLVVPFCLMGGFVAVYNYLTFRFEAPPFSLAPALAGLVFLAYLAGTVCSPWAGRAADRHGPLPVVLTGCAVMLAGLALTLAGLLAVVVAGLVVFTAGFFVAHAAASGWAPRLLPHDPPRASSSYVVAYYAGSSLFGALLGVAWDAGAWPATAAAVAVLVLLGAAAAVTCGRRRRPGSRSR